MQDEEALDIVGLRDIADMLGVDGRTPNIWRYRGILPPEDAIISGTIPVWRRETITAWANATGRMPRAR